ncbi:MAG: hypothetical protein JW953_03975 [Anaerolineae bacterium]|nr:hypothetical protein [Anaerolineae bacterium]
MGHQRAERLQPHRFLTALVQCVCTGRVQPIDSGCPPGSDVISCTRRSPTFAVSRAG